MKASIWERMTDQEMQSMIDREGEQIRGTNGYRGPTQSITIFAKKYSRDAF
jgi:hypothetical protein